jgi:hypothetical protein
MCLRLKLCLQDQLRARETKQWATLSWLSEEQSPQPNPATHRKYSCHAVSAIKWRVCIQIMPEADAGTYHINPFDLTKVWPHGD